MKISKRMTQAERFVAVKTFVGHYVAVRTIHVGLKDFYRGDVVSVAEVHWSNTDAVVVLRLDEDIAIPLAQVVSIEKESR